MCAENIKTDVQIPKYTKNTIFFFEFDFLNFINIYFPIFRKTSKNWETQLCAMDFYEFAW